MFDHLTNEGMLDDMLLDWTIFKLKHRHYPNLQYVWQRWIRSAQ